MEFNKLLKELRIKKGYGVRELARQTEKSCVPFPIKSPIYISRLENLVREEMKAEAISIDKLWALGVALELNPLILLAYSRDVPELVDCIASFDMRECDANISFSALVYGRRKDMNMTLREVETAAGSCSPWGISMAYLCQLEDGNSDYASKVSAEKLWALGRVYNIDPLLLYVLSRNIDPRYRKAIARDRLFS